MLFWLGTTIYFLSLWTTYQKQFCHFYRWLATALQIFLVVYKMNQLRTLTKQQMQSNETRRPWYCGEVTDGYRKAWLPGMSQPVHPMEWRPMHRAEAHALQPPRGLGTANHEAVLHSRAQPSTWGLCYFCSHPSATRALCSEPQVRAPQHGGQAQRRRGQKARVLSWQQSVNNGAVTSLSCALWQVSEPLRASTHSL